MKFAYADPPYLGKGRKFYSEHPQAAEWDTPEAHARLIARLVSAADGPTRPQPTR